MAYAQAGDVTGRWGQGRDGRGEETTDLITIRLGHAERRTDRGLKRRGLTTLADRITADLTDVEDVKQVEAEAVLRLVRNPDGYLSENDGDYGYMLRQDLNSGKLEILPEEWEALGVYEATGFFI